MRAAGGSRVRTGALLGATLDEVAPSLARVAGLQARQRTMPLPGCARTVDVRVADLCDPRGRPVGLVLVLRDVTELEALRAELAKQAIRDPLTGLHNRRYLTRALESLAAAGAAAGPACGGEHPGRLGPH